MLGPDHLTWERSHPATVHLYGWVISPDGQHRWLIGQATYYDAPREGFPEGCWRAGVLFDRVGDLVATSDEAVALAEAEWQRRPELHPPHLSNSAGRFDEE
jgi:hypothetical protein